MKTNPISELAQYVADYKKALMRERHESEKMDEEVSLFMENTADTLNIWFNEANVGIHAYTTNRLPSGQTSHNPVIKLRGRSGYEYGVFLGVSVPHKKDMTFTKEGCDNIYIHEKPCLIHGYSDNDELTDTIKRGMYPSLEEALKNKVVEATLIWAIKKEG